MSTTFAVATPTHARRELAVLCARSALNQTRPIDQLIVLCDGCTDGTQDALRALGDDRVEVVDLPKAAGYGYGHRNIALARARTTAITFIGDDDLLMPDHFELVGDRWDGGDVDIVQAQACEVRPDDTFFRPGRDWSEPRYRREFLELRSMTPMGSVSFRPEMALEVGGWDASLPRAADWDLYKRLLRAGARDATLIQPTMLYFKGSDREQPYADRVRQNTTYAQRLAGREELARLRSDISAGWAVDQSWLEHSHAERSDWLEKTVEAKEWLATEVADLQRRLGEDA